MPTSGSSPSRWRAGLGGVGRALLDTLWTPACLGCGLPVSPPGLCQGCGENWETLRLRRPCNRCGREVPIGGGQPCGGCVRESHWNLRGVCCVGRYEGVLRDLLLQIKFLGEQPVVDWCARALAEAVRARDWGGQLDLLVPIPMHPLRRLQRRGNHADQLGQVVARELGCPIRSVLRRTRWVESQTSQTSRQARMKQVRDTFAAHRRIHVEGKTVCLIDNVLVSGATVHEASRILRAAGAKRIYAATVGRAEAR